MCGRTACTLDPGAICRACRYKPRDRGEQVEPRWQESSDGRQYYPSHNVSPASHTPILFNHQEERVIQPMLWGMIPAWFKGSDPKSHGLSTNNCRMEGMLKSSLYSPSFNRGRRCIVLCDGFYEWQTKGKTKQPYFLYMPQEEGVKVEDPDTWNTGDGPRLMHMAALYNVWTPEDGNAVHSYSIITMESNDTLGWLHQRMPAILDSPEIVADWLDSDCVKSKDAFQLLKPAEELKWHPVSTLVNNSRNKDVTCNHPIKLGETPKKAETPSSRFMANWLKRTPTKESNTPEAKKAKV